MPASAGGAAATASDDSLSGRRDVTEKRALGSDLHVALRLARVHALGIGVPKSVALGYAWMLVGMYRGVDDPDQTAQAEVYERWIGMYPELSDADKAEAYRLYHIICESSSGPDAKGPRS